MTRWPLALRRASEHDLGVIVRLIEDAAAWLGTKNTDQWARPWPSRTGRDGRILADLRRGRTWIGWDGAAPAATVTVVVDRSYARVGLGAELLNWAGRTGRRDHGAIWIRVNAWTTNRQLHAYYRRQGFSLCGLSVDDSYPSAALFHKPTRHIKATSRGLFIEEPGAEL
jgi:GNAT superfamily N-acetyltransferase